MNNRRLFTLVLNNIANFLFSSISYEFVQYTKEEGEIMEAGSIKMASNILIGYRHSQLHYMEPIQHTKRRLICQQIFICPPFSSLTLHTCSSIHVLLYFLLSEVGRRRIFSFNKAWYL